MCCLTTDDNAGILSEEHHAMKCSISDGIDVWWSVKYVSASVVSNEVASEYTKLPIRVYRYNHLTNVGVHLPCAGRLHVYVCVWGGGVYNIVHLYMCVSRD